MRLWHCILVGATLGLAGCPASQAPSDSGVPDVRADRLFVSDGPDLDRGVADRSAEASPDLELPPRRVMVTSDIIVATVGGDVGLHVWWGQDHVVVGGRWFRRITDSGQVLAEKMVPDWPNTIPYKVASMAAGAKGIAALYGDDNYNTYLTLVQPDGTFGASAEQLPSRSGAVHGPVSVIARPGGFAILTVWSDMQGPVVQMQLADPDAKLIGSPVVVANHDAASATAAPDGRFSYVTIPFFGLQHGLMDPDPVAPKDTLSAPLLSPPHNTHLGLCGWQFHATTSTGVTWVAFGDLDTVGNYSYLAYNVEQGGKALLPTAQVFTTPGTKGMGRCVVGVATDDKQFLVVYGEEQPGPTYYQYHLFARIFDLDGTPIGPAQKLPLPFSYLLTLPECARGRLVWTGKDFVLFYFEQALNLGLGPMHMVRLSIQEP